MSKELNVYQLDPDENSTLIILTGQFKLNTKIIKEESEKLNNKRYRIKRD